MQSPIKIAIGMFIGVLLAGLVLFSLWSLHEDHMELQAVISFLNSQIKASQASSVPSTIK